MVRAPASGEEQLYPLTNPAASTPAMHTASSSSPVPPLAPAAPSTLPSLSLITTAPVCGRNLPCAVAESAPKN